MTRCISGSRTKRLNTARFHHHGVCSARHSSKRTNAAYLRRRAIMTEKCKKVTRMAVRPVQCEAKSARWKPLFFFCSEHNCSDGVCASLLCRWHPLPTPQGWRLGSLGWRQPAAALLRRAFATGWAREGGCGAGFRRPPPAARGTWRGCGPRACLLHAVPA